MKLRPVSDTQKRTMSKNRRAGGEGEATNSAKEDAKDLLE